MGIGFTGEGKLLYSENPFTTKIKYKKYFPLYFIFVVKLGRLTATVYNMEVDDYHAYFVGKKGIWTHNCKKIKIGRTVKQARLKEMANDDKLSSAIRGEIKRVINAIKSGKRTTVRVPQGHEMAHRYGKEAKRQHKFDNNGRKR